MRFANTEGPVVSARHYGVPPLDPMDLAARFDPDPANAVLRAACTPADRQDIGARVVTGSARQRNRGRVQLRTHQRGGRSGGQGRRTEPIAAIFGMIAMRARRLGDEIPTRLAQEVLADKDPHQALAELLTRWSAAIDDGSPRPPGTWSAAVPGPVLWSSSTAAATATGAKRCSAVGKRTADAKGSSGGCRALRLEARSGLGDIVRMWLLTAI